MVTLYDRDGVVVRDGLTVLADHATGHKNTSDLMHWLGVIGEAHATSAAADHPRQRGRLTAARLTSTAAAMGEQLPH
jgi:hypothetical protein